MTRLSTLTPTDAAAIGASGLARLGIRFPEDFVEEVFGSSTAFGTALLSCVRRSTQCPPSIRRFAHFLGSVHDSSDALVWADAVLVAHLGPLLADLCITPASPLPPPPSKPKSARTPKQQTGGEMSPALPAGTESTA